LLVISNIKIPPSEPAEYAGKREELETTLLQLAEETGDPILPRLEEELSNDGQYY